MKKNKKGDESTNATLLEAGTLILVIIIIIFLLSKLPNPFASSTGKETKKSFGSLNVAIKQTLEDGRANIVPFFIEGKYALVLFKEKEQKAGEFSAPTQCALLDCVAVCEKKECKVLSYEVYGSKYDRYTFLTNTKDGVLIPLGRQGIHNLHVIYDSKTNTLSINKVTEDIA